MLILDKLNAWLWECWYRLEFYCKANRKLDIVLDFLSVIAVTFLVAVGPASLYIGITLFLEELRG